MKKASRRTEYRKALRDPRWQKKRLFVLERAGWRCEWCGDHRSELQVHHGCYGVRGKPWEVPDDVLYCLCDPCHARAERAKQALHLEIGRVHPREHWRISQLLRRTQRWPLCDT